MLRQSPPHLVALDEGHPGADRRADERAHEPRGAGPDHHEIALEAPRAAVAAIDAPGTERVDDLLGDEGEDAEQEEGEPQLRGKDPREALDLPELRARVHVHQGAGKHPGLADEREHEDPHGREAHREVDDEERKHGDETEGEEIERPVLPDAAVNPLERSLEAAADRVASEVAGEEEGEGGTDEWKRRRR